MATTTAAAGGGGGPGGPGTGDKLISGAGEKGELTWNEFKKYGVNDGPKAVFIALWLLINIALIAERALYYSYRFNEREKDLQGVGLGGQDEYKSVAATIVIGPGIPVARGAASALKFNCALILFTVLRNILSALRRTCFGKLLPIDKAIVMHRAIAWTIAFLAAVHMAAHYMNYYSLAYLTRNENLKRQLMLPFLPAAMGTGPSLRGWPSPYGLAFSTVPGITGHVLIFVMTLMYTAALLPIRRPFFEMFWFTHHLFIVFFLVLCFHGAPGVLEPPTMWAWLLLPGICYAGERVWRVLRGNEDTALMMAIQHPSKVLELRLKKSTFDYMPGQYLFLQCPAVSRHEWHPFTITSAPEEDFISVHIRIVGDWTGALAKLFNPDKRLGVVAQDITTSADGRPILRIDGPFGAASEEAFSHKTVVLVGAGIGVTPFSSILKSVRYRLERQRATGIASLPVLKVYFYWISRDRSAFEWFSELLAALERDNINQFLEINTYLTGALKPQEIKSVMYDDDGDGDAITGLQSHTHFGRPNWPQIFDELAVKHQGERVGVFFCGPSVLSKVLYKQCRAKTMADNYDTRFVYHKENF